MITQLARRAPGTAPVTGRQRQVSLLLATVVVAMTALFWPTPAHAAPTTCTAGEWSHPSNVQNCINRLPKTSATVSDCMGIPTPSTPDSGFGGWFASDPNLKAGVSGKYSSYGYSGYTYPIYNPGCASGASPVPSDTSSTTTIANGELMVATGIVGAADAFRERAYEPAKMWGWSDKLVTTATKAVYEKVFSVFGAITLAIVGIYLVWRSRQANMSDALTTAGWAVMVMVVVTAVAAWPLVSAHLADSTLVTSLGIVHSAVGPQPKNASAAECPSGRTTNRPPGVKYDPDQCKDHRTASLRASDTATEAILYDNWLRGTLGSATSPTAKKYGLALYQSSALTWDQAKEIEKHPSKRATIIKQKADNFQRLASRIKTEDPEAYDYLQGKDGSGRVGAGLIAIISAIAFSFFDIAASLLIILGFLIFRWAVVAIPIIGTIAILRPASSGFKRLVNIVIAAIFNIVIFGAGASIYLFAVDIIMNTSTLPGWLQVTLVWLCGVAGWLLLRPYRRITQLGGKSPMGELLTIGPWHRRLVGEIKGMKDEIADQNTEQKKIEIGIEQSGDREAQTTVAAAPGDSVRAGGASEHAPVGGRSPTSAPSSPGGVDQPAVRSSADERVWVPATDRYAGSHSEAEELADMVRDSDARIGANADAIDREFSDYQRSGRART